jgi:hypothetical protein
LKGCIVARIECEKHSDTLLRRIEVSRSSSRRLEGGVVLCFGVLQLRKPVAEAVYPFSSCTA